MLDLIMFSLLATLMLIHDEKLNLQALFNSVVFEISAICRDPTTQWMLLTCLMVWCGTFPVSEFSLKDLPLIGLLLITIAICFISHAALSGTDALSFWRAGHWERNQLYFEKRKAESGKRKHTGNSEFSNRVDRFSGVCVTVAFGGGT